MGPVTPLIVVAPPPVNPDDHLPPSVGLPLLIFVLAVFGWALWRMFKM